MGSQTALSALPEGGQVTAALHWPAPRGPLVRRPERAALPGGPGGPSWLRAQWITALMVAPGSQGPP